MEEKILDKSVEIETKDLYGMFDYIKKNKLFDIIIEDIINILMNYNNKIKDDKNLESNINDIKKRLLNEKEVKIFNKHIKSELIDKCCEVNSLINDFKNHISCDCHRDTFCCYSYDYNCNCKTKNEKKYIFNKIEEIKKNNIPNGLKGSLLLNDLINYYKCLVDFFYDIDIDNKYHQLFIKLIKNKMENIISMKKGFMSNIYLNKDEIRMYHTLERYKYN